MKASFIYDILNKVPFLDDLIYGKKVKCFVKANYGKYETHYYELDENRNLLVWDKKKKPEDSVNNPVLVGKATYDEASRLVCHWVYGQPFAYFMDTNIPSESMMRKLYAYMDDKTNSMVTTGIIVGMNRVKGQKKGLFDDPIIYLLIGIAILVIIAIVFVYNGFQAQGIDLLKV